MQHELDAPVITSDDTIDEMQQLDVSDYDSEESEQS